METLQTRGTLRVCCLRFLSLFSPFVIYNRSFIWYQILSRIPGLSCVHILQVARKSRKGRRTKKGSGEVGPDGLIDANTSPQNFDDQSNEAEKPVSEAFLDTNKTIANLSDSSSAPIDVTSISNQHMDPDVPLKDASHGVENILPTDGDKENNPNNLTYETEDSSDNDQLPATSEVEFNVTRLVSSFANNVVIHNLCWLLKHYKSNSASTNYYIICMLRRFCDDLDLSPMLYQVNPC